MILTAVMVVRDEADVVANTIRHHRALVDEVLVVDNGSVDGTTDVLASLSAADPAVRWRSQPGPFHQDVIRSDLAREAHARGADWVVPVDADELWWCEGDLRAVLEASDAGGLACRVDNFVQDRAVVERVGDTRATMRWRAEVRASEEESPERVQAGEISFLEMHYPPKYICRPTPDVIIHMGSHHVDRADGELATCDELSVLHAPIRCKVMLTQRAAIGRRRALEQPDVRIGWHLRRVAALEDAGRLDEEWAACSVLDGALDVSGHRHPVVRDDRLVNLMAALV